MDYVVVEEDSLAAIPESLSFEEAGAIPTVTLTAWQALFEHGKLQQGQRILIHGGAGGVGHAAIQLAKQHGAYVITTAREKIQNSCRWSLSIYCSRSIPSIP